KTKLWREDLERFWRELPAAETRIASFASEPLDHIADEKLADYLEQIDAFVGNRIFEHFRYIPTGVLPIGDFLTHAVEWTGATPREAVAVLRGHSPASVAAGRALEAAAAAIAGDERARAILDSAETADENVAR